MPDALAATPITQWRHRVERIHMPLVTRERQ